MRYRIFVTTGLTLLFICSLAFSHTNYVGYSGAPGSRGRCASSCHGGSGGTIEIGGFPQEYIPSQTYTIAISHSGGNSIRQFNGSCRIGDGSENAGIIAAGENTVTYSTYGETNGIHFSSSGQESGTFEWTAPSEGVGEVRLYIAGLQGGFGGQNSALEIVSTEQATGISDDDDLQAIPRLLSLGNHPNPFNSSTTITYISFEDSFVRVDVFDLLGRKVETLLEGRQSSGLHRLIWNADGMPSGVYFYILQMEDYDVAGKMMLLR
jgi:hypothetical protein